MFVARIIMYILWSFQFSAQNMFKLLMKCWVRDTFWFRSIRQRTLKMNRNLAYDKNIYLQLALENHAHLLHYTDVIMTTMASQITSLTVVYSTVYSDADQRKHQSPASLAFVRGIHRDRWIPRTKGQLRGKCFHLMTSSWKSHVLL